MHLYDEFNVPHKTEDLQQSGGPKDWIRRHQNWGRQFEIGRGSFGIPYQSKWKYPIGYYKVGKFIKILYSLLRVASKDRYVCGVKRKELNLKTSMSMYCTVYMCMLVIITYKLETKSKLLSLSLIHI